MFPAAETCIAWSEPCATHRDLLTANRDGWSEGRSAAGGRSLLTVVTAVRLTFATVRAIAVRRLPASRRDADTANADGIESAAPWPGAAGAVLPGYRGECVLPLLTLLLAH